MKLNFMKFPSIIIHLCFKQVFENATTGRKSRCRSFVNSGSCELQLSLAVLVPAGASRVV
jgi:hypothetical protein